MESNFKIETEVHVGRFFCSLFSSHLTHLQIDFLYTVVAASYASSCLDDQSSVFWNPLAYTGVWCWIATKFTKLKLTLTASVDKLFAIQIESKHSVEHNVFLVSFFVVFLLATRLLTLCRLNHHTLSTVQPPEHAKLFGIKLLEIDLLYNKEGVCHVVGGV